jgi:hypothetical protein
MVRTKSPKPVSDSTGVGISSFSGKDSRSISWSPASEDGGKDSGDNGSIADRGEIEPTMGEADNDIGDRTGDVGSGKGGDEGCRSGEDDSRVGLFVVEGAGSEMFRCTTEGTGDGAGDVVRAEMRRRAWRGKGSLFQRPRSAETVNVTRESEKKGSCSSSSLSVSS